MTISDVLSEAADEIESYMKNEPQTYATLKDDIDRLLVDMDRIRVELDTPPSRKNR